MKLLRTPMLYEYSNNHPEIVNSIKAWIFKVSKAKWKNESDVLESLPKTQFIHANEALFEIAPNQHYLSALINYSAKAVVVKKVAHG